MVPPELYAKRDALAATEAAYQLASVGFREVCEAAEKSKREFRLRISDAAAAVDRAKNAWIDAAPQLKAVNAEIDAILA